jgi:hypothetical protein
MVALASRWSRVPDTERPKTGRITMAPKKTKTDKAKEIPKTEATESTKAESANKKPEPKPEVVEIPNVNDRPNRHSSH